MSQGKATLEGIVRKLGALAQQGEPVAILWDMDGTLVDTRPRMLASVHTYGRTDVELTDVSPSWQETAHRLGLDPDRFRAVWQRVFWAYESFDADIENEEVAALARLAESLGIQTVIVTGRIEELRPVTARQLDRLGLKPTRVFLKSEMGDCTPSVKGKVITQLAQEGLTMGAFVTDSPEEIAAVTPEVLSHARDLECIFVELEGLSPQLREGVHRLTVPFRNGPRMAAKPADLAVGEGSLAFGFEAEYEIERAHALLRLYDPLPEAGLSAGEWHGLTAVERAEWVYSQFPEPHSEEFALPLKRNETNPLLDFLPSGLFVDSDGNIEVVSRPTEDLSLLWSQIERLENAVGPPLLQVTISAPGECLWEDPKALDGYLTFSHFLDILERMQIGARQYSENPDREVLLPFLHPWLGPMTAGKHRFMRQYLEANCRGERLDEKWVRLVDRAFSSFKYITGSAYRPALAGKDRIAIEIRDAHRNKALLAQRVSRHAVSLMSGLEPYKPFAGTWAFDSETDYEKLSPRVREMLESVIPTRERPEIDFMYSDYDRIALQVYRNFAKPLKDYSDVEGALDDGGDSDRLAVARQAYVEMLEKLALEREEKSEEQIRRELQGALAHFAVESGLAERFQRFSERCLSRASAREALNEVHRFLPLTRALPRTAWRGSLQSRLERLVSLWPEQVQVCSEVSVVSRGGVEASLPLVLLSVEGLSQSEREALRGDFLDAVALQTLGIRATDRGSLELRFGRFCYSPGGWSTEENEYRPFAVGAGMEPVLCLSSLESYCMGRQLAAHRPCDEAARRVSASGWLRHLSMGLGGETLEGALSLPRPESIETAIMVLERVVRCADSPRLGFVVQWTERSVEEWLARHGGAEKPVLRFEPSTIASGFPLSLKSEKPFSRRLEGLVERWPGHARLVENVPFVFGKGTKPRRVLVVALKGLVDDEFDAFREDYLDIIGADTVSFPCRLRAEHLRARVGKLALALSAEGVRVDFYEPPWNRRRMEAVIELEPSEVSRLRQYIGAVIDDTLGMLGPITLGAGCRKAANRLNDNRPADGGRHNCTTWVTLSPVCEDGRDLAQLVEMPDSWTSHDNPGWWSMFLTGASRSDRVHTVIYWTDLPLGEDPTRPGEPIEWDFNPH